jgi:hypothetical protein
MTYCGSFIQSNTGFTVIRQPFISEREVVRRGRYLPDGKFDNKIVQYHGDF